ncbi:helix-turn-helix domain-containing protein [Nonomuraea sp. LPB2021202275-12-8]|uniref:helix-turn-helix domain-containing protein n=1 Tax=Nonomuraea sp. LPB2021202275-12-8 TaxID=3120159 RepID=UPI00300BFF1B
MDNGTNDPASVVLTIGQRIRYWRERRGMSQETLAGLIGRSTSWLKQAENDRRPADSLSVLLRIADVLHIRNLADLTGVQSMPVRMFAGPGHPALAEVRTAINVSPLLLPSGTVQPLNVIRARLDAAWRTRHTSPDHRTALGRLLPDLLRDTQLAAAMYHGADRRRAQALLAEVYGLTQMFVAYQPAQDLLWRVADRALLAAQESEDPLAIACAVWFLAQAHRDTGDYDAARDINEQGMFAIQPHLDDDPTVELRAMWGALSFELSYTAARLGDAGEAWRHWSEAQHVAEGLPKDYYQPWTSFSRVIMKAHAVTVAVELHQGGESARQAASAESIPIPSQPRRGRHLIEVARAYQLQRDFDAMLGALQLAQQTAPETIKYNGYAKRMAYELVNSGPSYLRVPADHLADQIGLMV